MRRAQRTATALFVVALASAGSQPAALRSLESKETAPAFRVGEKLEYRISWAAFASAARAELAVTERRPFYGREAWHFQALARTTDFARSLYELDNQFDSYTDTATLASFRFEQHLREQGKRETHVARMAGDGLPVQNHGAMVRVAPGTRDPLGVLYYLRTIDWPRQREVRTPVFNGRRLFEIQATYARSVAVTVPAGAYTASRVDLRVFENKKELTSVRFAVWFAQDADRTPALIEAEMPFGTLRVELMKAARETRP